MMQIVPSCSNAAELKAVLRPVAVFLLTPKRVRVLAAFTCRLDSNAQEETMPAWLQLKMVPGIIVRGTWNNKTPFSVDQEL